MPVIGLLKNTTAAASTLQVAAFRQGLKEMGYDEGRNVAIEYHCADNHYDRLLELAADLVHRHVDVIMAAGDNPARAAKAAHRRFQLSSLWQAIRFNSAWSLASTDRVAISLG
jgi:putative ABC transport system substrate-binding protein